MTPTLPMVAATDEVICWECGAGGDLHDHHVVPSSLGGMRTVPLCGDCHGKIHAHPGLLSTSRLTADAMRRKIERGECVGSVPYGSRLAADGKHLEADPAEMVAIATAQRLRAEGLSLRAIGDRLTAAGCVPRAGNAWNPNTIARLCVSTIRHNPGTTPHDQHQPAKPSSALAPRRCRTIPRCRPPHRWPRDVAVRGLRVVVVSAVQPSLFPDLVQGGREREGVARGGLDAG